MAERNHFVFRQLSRIKGLAGAVHREVFTIVVW